MPYLERCSASNLLSSHTYVRGGVPLPSAGRGRKDSWPVDRWTILIYWYMEMVCCFIIALLSPVQQWLQRTMVKEIIRVCRLPFTKADIILEIHFLPAALNSVLYFFQGKQRVS